MRGRGTAGLPAAILLAVASVGSAAPSEAATFSWEAADAGSDTDLVVTAQVRPNLFGTVAIPGPQGRWAEKWSKVLGDTRSNNVLHGLVAPAKSLGRLQQLRFLQAEIDRRVGWRSDTTQYGARTYWATAAETLASGVGDDDDRAILKYQALRELGYPRSDYYLVMGRDRVRGDYVMLAARAEGRWWLLEEQGDAPVPAEMRTGFEPAASFGSGKTWIHGRKRQLAGSAPRGTTLASAAGASQR